MQPAGHSLPTSALGVPLMMRSLTRHIDTDDMQLTTYCNYCRYFLVIFPRTKLFLRFFLANGGSMLHEGRAKVCLCVLDRHVSRGTQSTRWLCVTTSHCLPVMSRIHLKLLPALRRGCWSLPMFTSTRSELTT